MISTNCIEALQAAFGPALRLHESLARHSSARLGGPAEALLVADSGEMLARAARVAWDHSIPLRVLGGGANVLISDHGLPGLVVINRAGQVTFSDCAAQAESGIGLIYLARLAARRGLSGLEWAIGVPGTLGGAIYGNAGAHGSDIAATTQLIDYIAPEGRQTLNHAALAFEYRASILKRELRPGVILGATLDLRPDDPAAINARMDEFNAYRKRSQPPGATLGSMFKNPPGDFAGRLIEAAGLKGRRIGGAEISTVHANFFLNTGDATSSDVKALIDLAREEVMKGFGVALELEVELLGEW